MVTASDGRPAPRHGRDERVRQTAAASFVLACELGLQLFKVNTANPSWLGEYRPADSTLLMLDDLSPAEEAMVWVHELCHVRLHPPGVAAAGDRVDHGDDREEPVTHHAAAAICAKFDIGGYRRAMLRRRVPPALFPARLARARWAERDRLAEDVYRALLSPKVRPDW